MNSTIGPVMVYTPWDKGPTIDGCLTRCRARCSHQGILSAIAALIVRARCRVHYDLRQRPPRDALVNPFLVDGRRLPPKYLPSVYGTMHFARKISTPAAPIHNLYCMVTNHTSRSEAQTTAGSHVTTYRATRKFYSTKARSKIAKPGLWVLRMSHLGLYLPAIHLLPSALPHAQRSKCSSGHATISHEPGTIDMSMHVITDRLADRSPPTSYKPAPFCAPAGPITLRKAPGASILPIDVGLVEHVKFKH